MARVFWSCILLITLYVLAVFFAPKESDELSNLAWFPKFNQFLRNIKADVNSWVTLPIDQLNNGQQMVEQARDIANKTQQTIDTTKNLLNVKAEQINKTSNAVNTAVDSAQKTADDLYKVRDSALGIIAEQGADKKPQAGSGLTGNTGSVNIEMQGGTYLDLIPKRQ